MTEFTKIAVTVPTAIYAVVERLRRRLGKSRSAVVALALEDWVRKTDFADADRRYIEGYLRVPESLEEIAAVAEQATSHWDPWLPGAPSIAAEPAPTAASDVRAMRASLQASRPRPVRAPPQASPSRPVRASLQAPSPRAVSAASKPRRGRQRPVTAKRPRR